MGNMGDHDYWMSNVNPFIYKATESLFDTEDFAADTDMPPKKNDVFSEDDDSAEDSKSKPNQRQKRKTGSSSTVSTVKRPRKRRKVTAPKAETTPLMKRRRRSEPAKLTDSPTEQKKRRKTYSTAKQTPADAKNPPQHRCHANLQLAEPKTENTETTKLQNPRPLLFYRARDREQSAPGQSVYTENLLLPLCVTCQSLLNFLEAQDDSLKCPFACPLSLPTRETFRIHTITKHLNCECMRENRLHHQRRVDFSCGQPYQQSFSATFHWNYDCPDCDEQHLDHRHLANHLVNNHEILSPIVTEVDRPKYLCTLSSDYLLDKPRTKVRAAKSENSGVNCLICQLRFPTVRRYLEHYRHLHSALKLLKIPERSTPGLTPIVEPAEELEDYISIAGDTSIHSSEVEQDPPEYATPLRVPSPERPESQVDPLPEPPKPKVMVVEANKNENLFIFKKDNFVYFKLCPAKTACKPEPPSQADPPLKCEVSQKPTPKRPNILKQRSRKSEKPEDPPKLSEVPPELREVPSSNLAERLSAGRLILRQPVVGGKARVVTVNTRAVQTIMMRNGVLVTPRNQSKVKCGAKNNNCGKMMLTSRKLRSDQSTIAANLKSPCLSAENVVKCKMKKKKDKELMLTSQSTPDQLQLTDQLSATDATTVSSFKSEVKREKCNDSVLTLPESTFGQSRLSVESTSHDALSESIDYIEVKQAERKVRQNKDLIFMSHESTTDQPGFTEDFTPPDALPETLLQSEVSDSELRDPVLSSRSTSDEPSANEELKLIDTPTESLLQPKGKIDEAHPVDSFVSRSKSDQLEVEEPKSSDTFAVEYLEEIEPDEENYLLSPSRSAEVDPLDIGDMEVDQSDNERPVSFDTIREALIRSGDKFFPPLSKSTLEQLKVVSNKGKACSPEVDESFTSLLRSRSDQLKLPETLPMEQAPVKSTSLTEDLAEPPKSTEGMLIRVQADKNITSPSESTLSPSKTVKQSEPFTPIDPMLHSIEEEKNSALILLKSTSGQPKVMVEPEPFDDFIREYLVMPHLSDHLALPSKSTLDQPKSIEESELDHPNRPKDINESITEDPLKFTLDQPREIESFMQFSSTLDQCKDVEKSVTQISAESKPDHLKQVNETYIQIAVESTVDQTKEIDELFDQASLMPTSDSSQVDAVFTRTSNYTSSPRSDASGCQKTSTVKSKSSASPKIIEEHTSFDPSVKQYLLKLQQDHQNLTKLMSKIKPSVQSYQTPNLKPPPKNQLKVLTKAQRKSYSEDEQRLEMEKPASPELQGTSTKTEQAPTLIEVKLPLKIHQTLLMNGEDVAPTVEVNSPLNGQHISLLDPTTLQPSLMENQPISNELASPLLNGQSSMDSEPDSPSTNLPVLNSPSKISMSPKARQNEDPRIATSTKILSTLQTSPTNQSLQKSQSPTLHHLSTPLKHSLKSPSSSSRIATQNANSAVDLERSRMLQTSPKSQIRSPQKSQHGSTLKNQPNDLGQPMLLNQLNLTIADQLVSPKSQSKSSITKSPLNDQSKSSTLADQQPPKNQQTYPGNDKISTQRSSKKSQLSKEISELKAQKLSERMPKKSAMTKTLRGKKSKKPPEKAMVPRKLSRGRRTESIRHPSAPVVTPISLEAEELQQLDDEPTDWTKPRVCPKCNKTFSTMKELVQHFYSVGELGDPTPPTTSPPWRCHQCYKFFTNYQLLIYHQYFHHDDESMIHICDNCCKILTTASMAYNHVCQYVSSFNCKTCGLHFENGREFLEHNRKSHFLSPGPYKCSKCRKTFLTNAMLVVHMEQVCSNPRDTIQLSQNSDRNITSSAVSANLLRCNICNISRNNFEELLNHVKAIHSVEFCKLCEKCYPMGNTVQHVMQQHLWCRNILPEIHGELEEVIEFFMGLLGHGHLVSLSDYVLPGSSTLECKKCSREFANSAHYNTHIAEDHDTVCILCNLSFPNATVAVKHKSEQHGSATNYIWIANKVMKTIYGTPAFKEIRETSPITNKLRPHLGISARTAEIMPETGKPRTSTITTQVSPKPGECRTPAIAMQTSPEFGKDRTPTPAEQSGPDFGKVKTIAVEQVRPEFGKCKRSAVEQTQVGSAVSDLEKNRFDPGFKRSKACRTMPRIRHTRLKRQRVPVKKSECSNRTIDIQKETDAEQVKPDFEAQIQLNSPQQALITDGTHSVCTAEEVLASKSEFEVQIADQGENPQDFGRRAEQAKSRLKGQELLVSTSEFEKPTTAILEQTETELTAVKAELLDEETPISHKQVRFEIVEGETSASSKKTQSAIADQGTPTSKDKFNLHFDKSQFDEERVQLNGAISTDDHGVPRTSIVASDDEENKVVFIVTEEDVERYRDDITGFARKIGEDCNLFSTEYVEGMLRKTIFRSSTPL